MPRRPYTTIFEAKEVIGSTEEAIASFQPKEYLHPDFWDSDQNLHPEVRERLLDIAQDFYDSLATDAPLKDVQFTGSLANFNFSKFSDIDLHIVMSFAEIDSNTELVRDYADSKKSLWNQKHDIEIHDMPVEIYLQDTAQETVSSGIYSVMDGQWIKAPTAGQFTLDAPEVENKALSLMAEIDEIIASKDLDRADKFWDKLKQLRTAGLQEGGEYSPEALAFKTLRRNGYLEKLSDFEDKAYDAEKSI